MGTLPEVIGLMIKERLNKIREHGLLEESILEELENIVSDRDGVEGLSWVDLSVGTSHMDCAHIAQTRYPTDDYTSYDMLHSGDAELKIILAEKLIQIIKDNLN